MLFIDINSRIYWLILMLSENEKYSIIVGKKEEIFKEFSK